LVDTVYKLIENNNLLNKQHVPQIQKIQKRQYQVTDAVVQPQNLASKIENVVFTFDCIIALTLAKPTKTKDKHPESKTFEIAAVRGRKLDHH